jgi:hypothetical protein
VCRVESFRIEETGKEGTLTGSGPGRRVTEPRGTAQSFNTSRLVKDVCRQLKGGRHVDLKQFDIRDAQTLDTGHRPCFEPIASGDSNHSMERPQVLM